MTNKLRGVIKRVRKKRRKRIDTSLPKGFVEFHARQRQNGFRQQEIVQERDRNFTKMLNGNEKWREEQQVEKDRQEEISKVRLKNLRKARRARRTTNA